MSDPEPERRVKRRRRIVVPEDEPEEESRGGSDSTPFIIWGAIAIGVLLLLSIFEFINR